MVASGAAQLAGSAVLVECACGRWDCNCGGFAGAGAPVPLSQSRLARPRLAQSCTSRHSQARHSWISTASKQFMSGSRKKMAGRPLFDFVYSIPAFVCIGCAGDHAGTSFVDTDLTYTMHGWPTTLSGTLHLNGADRTGSHRTSGSLRSVLLSEEHGTASRDLAVDIPHDKTPNSCAGAATVETMQVCHVS